MGQKEFFVNGLFKQQASFKDGTTKQCWQPAPQHHHHHHHEGGFFGMSKLTLAVVAACACSLFYILTIMLSSGAAAGGAAAGCNGDSIGTKHVYYVCNTGNGGGCVLKSGLPPPLEQQVQRVPNTNTSTMVAAVAGSTPTARYSAPAANATTAEQKAAGALPSRDDSTTTGTSLAHIVFGIAASSRLWERRKEYLKLWWRPNEMRGFVWMDKKVRRWSKDYPRLRVSSPTDGFNYTNKMGSRAAIRISRVVSETYRQGLGDVHWYVMGDDDTFFIADNLVRVLSKYDHRRYHYIGATSESHTQNLHFSYNMAYGGGGFAISAPLAAALERVQDDCLHRYPYLFGSDDRIQACMAELGVPLTKEPGFHQFDIYGDASGLLAAHPVAPLVSLHHLDVISPLFPNMTQAKSLAHLRRAIHVDPAGILQQSICYDKWRKWSFSVSWGYAVQVYRGLLPPRELELPSRTFLSWYRRTEDSGFPFSTRPMSSNPCEQPTVFYMQSVSVKDPSSSTSIYIRETRRRGECRWRMASPAGVEWIRVVKERTDKAWHLAPRRQCCRILNSSKKNVEIEVGACRVGEFIA